MALMKTAVKAAGTAIQTGAEKALRSLPTDQADTIIKAFGFKPGSAQDAFVRQGGIHPTDGPGIINSIQRGEAQDLPQHITNAVGGEPNSLTRFSDNSTNQLNEETIKANGLKQVHTPTVTYKKGGSLEAPRKAIQDFVEADPTRKDKLLSGEIKRGTIANIVDDTGDVKDIQGMTKFLTTNDANFLTFPSRTKRKASKGVRLNLMKAPEKELRQFASNEFPGNPELIEEYLNTYAKGFAAVQEAARRNGITPKQLWEELATGKLTPRHKKVLDQYDAGHWFSTRYNLDKVTDPLDRTPTSGRSARIESRTENIKGGAKIEHETNPHLAEMLGIPRTWKEDFLLFADSKLNQKGLPQWEELVGSTAMRLVESLPHNASKAEAEVVFKQIMEIVNKQGESAKDFQRTARLENRPPSDNPDYYLYGKDQEIEVDEYAPIPGDPEFE